MYYLFKYIASKNVATKMFRLQIENATVTSDEKIDYKE